MIELISIVCALAACILTPVEMGKIRNGWTAKRFAGDRPKFLAAYRKQLNLLVWLGLLVGAINIGLAVIETHPAERIVKLVAAAIWFAAAAISFFSRSRLPEA